jgi:hypothetical protein
LVVEKLKRFACVCWDDITCPHLKRRKFSALYKCVKCPHYKRFEREMEEQEVEDAEFVEAVERDPEAYLRGEI